MGRLQGKCAVITGAAAGIGKASALRFAQEGAALGLIDKNPAGAEVAEAVAGMGGKAHFVEADVGDAAKLTAAIEACVAAIGGLDILYNNAGGATPGDGFARDMPLDEFAGAIDLNLYAPFVGCRVAIPHMERRGGGSIINTASIRAMIGTQGADAYTAAKGGVVTLTRALALQCAPMKIRVNAIAPGVVLTERIRAFMDQGNDSGPDALLTGRSLLGFGLPEQIASAALFLASDEASWITGQVLPVDGGASI